MTPNKITIEGIDYELDCKSSNTVNSTKNPIVYFGNNCYIGKAIPNKPDKDYEIISFINTGGDIFELTDGYWYKQKTSRYIDTDKWRTLEHLLNHAINCKIHSVKRKDSTIWTLEEQTTYGKISKFYIDAGNFMKVEFTNGCGATLQSLEKVKERILLFMADNGLTPVYEGDAFWGVDLDFRAYKNYKSWDSKYFSTEEKASDYVILNKPDKSVNDVLNCFDKSRSFVGMDFLKEKLIELTKEKLNK